MAHPDLFKALSRLIEGKPIRILPGYKINKDTVALEAGRKRGSIKKSRPSNAILIKAIQEAAEAQCSPLEKAKQNIAKTQSKAQYDRALLHEVLNREVMYQHRIEDLEKQLSNFRKFTSN